MATRRQTVLFPAPAFCDAAIAASRAADIIGLAIGTSFCSASASGKAVERPLACIGSNAPARRYRSRIPSGLARNCDHARDDRGRTEPFVSRVGPVLVVVLVIDLLSSPKKTEIEDDEEEDWERRVKSAFHFGFSCEA